MWFVPSWLGHPPPQPFSGPPVQFLGARTIIADISNDLMFALSFWLACLFILFLFRILLCREWAAAVAWVLLFTVLGAAGNRFAPVDLVIALIFWSAWYASISLAGILLMAVIAFYGFYTSLGGRPVFGGAAFEE